MPLRKEKYRNFIIIMLFTIVYVPKKLNININKLIKIN